ncbi:hypothetical protein [Albirhodobacter sp. R86504]|jgi:hypothetical protein|uniref:hypothetical protein n=1 Tax=Albirhodobacter sp. R86504 TaxID=3093848 RepID=UPI00366FBB40
MQLVSDILLGVSAICVAAYCLVHARRMRRFNQLETGMGGAIAVLSAQVDEMTLALKKAHAAAEVSSQSLVEVTQRAEQGAERIELLLASLHDLPDPEEFTRRRLSRRRARPDAGDSE